MFRTLDEMERAHTGAGGHWFDPASMRFFGCKLYPNEVKVSEGKTWFLSSERDRSGEESRRYTLRSFDHETFMVATEGEFRQYATLSAARKALRGAA